MMKKNVSKKLLEELYTKSSELMEEEDYEAARKIYAKLIDLDPDNTSNYYNHALTYFHCQEFPQSYILFEKLSGIEMPGDMKKNVEELRIISKSGLLGRQGFDLKEAHEPELAIPLLKRAVDLHPDNHEARYFLGIINQSLENSEAAAECYEYLMDMDDDPEFQCRLKMRLGECYLDLNMLEKAETLFGFILLNDENDEFPLLHFYFADIEFRRQNIEKSLIHLKAFKKAVEMFAESKESDSNQISELKAKFYRARISIHEAAGEKEKAVKLAKQYFNKVLKQEMNMDFTCVCDALGTLETNKEWDYLRFLDKREFFHNFGFVGLAPLDLYLKAILALEDKDLQTALYHFLKIKEFVHEFSMQADIPDFDELWKMLSTLKDDYSDFNIPDSEPAFGVFVDEKIAELEGKT